MEAHDKLGHQGTTHTYCLIKWQYYWKGMNKEIRKYIANCTLCCREKVKVQSYPLQMTELPEQPFDKIVIDLVSECETSTLASKHILTNHQSSHRMAEGPPHTKQVNEDYSVNIP